MQPFSVLIDRVIRARGRDHIDWNGDPAVKTLALMLVYHLDDEANTVDLDDLGATALEVFGSAIAVDPNVLALDDAEALSAATELDRLLDLVELSIMSAGIDELNE